MQTLKNIQPRGLSLVRLLSKAGSVIKNRVLQRVAQSKYRIGVEPKLEVISAGPRWSRQGAPIISSTAPLARRGCGTNIFFLILPRRGVAFTHSACADTEGARGATNSVRQVSRTTSMT